MFASCAEHDDGAADAVTAVSANARGCQYYYIGDAYHYRVEAYYIGDEDHEGDGSARAPSHADWTASPSPSTKPNNRSDGLCPYAEATHVEDDILGDTKSTAWLPAAHRGLDYGAPRENCFGLDRKGGRMCHDPLSVCIESTGDSTDAELRPETEQPGSWFFTI
mmetsp:Transcript_64614/g.189028  ORF Transcript_64614/g.189028 Transcript_64614/m.189028 type:complete len:164 (-) Transcript_64614:262-753(-)